MNAPLIILAIALGLVLFALKQNINLFYTPTELQHADVAFTQSVRVGGYVKQNSVHYAKDGQSVSFVVTDKTSELTVVYAGVLPNLFREGQVVVITGKLKEKNLLNAHEVLAKHDERYMPKPLAKNLKRGST